MIHRCWFFSSSLFMFPFCHIGKAHLYPVSIPGEQYLQVRTTIEESGTHTRWEFDRKRLFEHTNYMAKVCGDLYEVAVVLDEFDKFLGPELKAVTGESEGIDEVINQVNQLVKPLEAVPFVIFDRRYKDSWLNSMTLFKDDVVNIENKTKSFIAQSPFKKNQSNTFSN